MRGPLSSRGSCGKVLKTLYLTLLMGSLSMPFTALGPALPDLQLVLHSTLASASSVYLFITVFSICGCAAASLVERVLGSNLAICLGMAGMVAFLTAAALISSLHLFIALYCGIGLTSYLVYTIIPPSISRLWENPAPALRLLTLAVTAGSMLGPLVVSPFASPSHCFQGREHNGTRTGGLNGTGEEEEGGECGGSIHLAFLTLASLSGLAFMGAVVVLVVEGRGRVPLPKSKKYAGPMQITPTKTKSYRALFLAVGILHNMASSSCVYVVAAWLPVYGLHSSLGLGLPALTTLDGLFYAGILAGNVLCIVLALFVDLKPVMAVSAVGMVGVSAALLLMGDKSRRGFTAGMISFGFLSASTFGDMSLLVSEVMELSTAVAALYTMALLMSLDILTYLGGVLLGAAGYWTFLWIPLTLSTLTALTFGVVWWIMRCLKAMGAAYKRLPTQVEVEDDGESLLNGEKTGKQRLLQ